MFSLYLERVELSTTNMWVPRGRRDGFGDTADEVLF
jgi:hypothetical protein